MDAGEDEVLENGIADEVEDASLLDMVEGAAGAVDIDLGISECDGDALMVRRYSCSC